MTKVQMVSVVDRQLEAYNRRDLDAFCACYHPEVRIEKIVCGVKDESGLASFTENYRGLFAANPNLHCELKSRIVVDTAIIDEEWVTGAARFPEGLHAVAIYGFRDGLIDRVWFTR